MGEPLRTGFWRWINRTGLERCELHRAAEEWILRGTLLVMAKGLPTEARYEVVCDNLWRTRRAHISLRDKSGDRFLNVSVENHCWFADGRLNPALTSCTDIDLEWSPSTNTLPIRRLGLAVGARSGPVVAAWVRFPSLELQPLAQEYERISERCYRYTSSGGAFSAELSVDDEGLVIDYEGIWKREAGKTQS
jgi:hypothetical protein